MWCQHFHTLKSLEGLSSVARPDGAAPVAAGRPAQPKAAKDQNSFLKLNNQTNFISKYASVKV